MDKEGYTEEQIYTRSEEDGILLDGVLTRPAEEAPKDVAFVFIHGSPISANLPFTSNIGRALAGHRYAFVAANTRGHDIGSWLFRKDDRLMLGGAWWELFDESPRDLAGWVGFTVDVQGFQGAVLVGHSFGAFKAVYYQAERQDPRVLGVVAAAPVMRPHAWGSARRPTPERTELAERLVSEGRHLDLLPWDEYGAPHGTVSAQTYLSWVRADNLDLFGQHTPNPAVSKIRCPLYACYGTNDEDTGTEADLEMIRKNATVAASVETWMFEGAGHGFTGHEGELAAALAAWAEPLA